MVIYRIQCYESYSSNCQILELVCCENECCCYNVLRFLKIQHTCVSDITNFIVNYIVHVAEMEWFNSYLIQ